MNITFCLTKAYGKFSLLGRCQNKPNSKPIQTQSQKSQNEHKILFNKGLWKWTVPSPYGKTNPIKPNRNQTRKPLRWRRTRVNRPLLLAFLPDSPEQRRTRQHKNPTTKNNKNDVQKPAPLFGQKWTWFRARFFNHIKGKILITEHWIFLTYYSRKVII